MADEFQGRLMDFLCGVSLLKEKENRTALLDTLPGGPVSAMPRSEAPRMDLTNIVKNAAEWGWIPTKRKWALEIVMENVRQFVKDFEGEDKLDGFIDEFRQSTQMRQISVRVAVIAMTKEEANFVASEQHLEQLRATLQEHHITDITSYYKASRNAWRPLAAKQASIQKIIYDLVKKLNEVREEAGLPTIRIQYVSDGFLSKDIEERRRAREILEELGGILIVDAISMYHDTLRRIFLSHQIISKNNPIAMIVVSPLEPNVLKVNELLENQIYASHLEKGFDLFANHLDPFYEFGVGGTCNLRRWLSSTLPSIGNRSLSREQRAAIRTTSGRIPRGLDRFITGGPRL